MALHKAAPLHSRGWLIHGTYHTLPLSLAQPQPRYIGAQVPTQVLHVPAASTCSQLNAEARKLMPTSIGVLLLQTIYPAHSTGAGCLGSPSWWRLSRASTLRAARPDAALLRHAHCLHAAGAAACIRRLPTRGRCGPVPHRTDHHKATDACSCQAWRGMTRLVLRLHGSSPQEAPMRTAGLLGCASCSASKTCPRSCSGSLRCMAPRLAPQLCPRPSAALCVYLSCLE